MYALKQVRARENVRAFAEKHALSLGFRRASCFRSLGNWVAPSKWKVLPLLYVLLLYLMPFSNQTIQKKMRGRKRSKTVQCMICLAVSADSSSKDSFAPCRWDGQEKKRGLKIFFFLRGEGFVPHHSRKAKRGGNLVPLWKIVMICVT